MHWLIWRIGQRCEMPWHRFIICAYRGPNGHDCKFIGERIEANDVSIGTGTLLYVRFHRSICVQKLSCRCLVIAIIRDTEIVTVI